MNSRDEVVLTLTDDLDTDQSSLGDPFTPSTRRVALVGHYFFRVLAVLVYFFCTWFTYSFVVPFVLVLISLSMDFWFVKNISGRILAGLRWSSYTDENGHTRWRFDHRPALAEPKSGMTFTRRELAHRASLANAARLFWIGLVATPLIWSLFLMVAVFSLHFRWALVSGIALCMSAVNLYGFVRCRLSGSSTTTTGNMLSDLHQRVTGQFITGWWSNITKRNIAMFSTKPEVISASSTLET